LHAQQPSGDACSPVRISREKIVDFQTAFGAADARAKARRGDATVVKAAHTPYQLLTRDSVRARYSDRAS
jgi:hypothetical protein